MAENQSESLYVALGIKPDSDYESAVIAASDLTEMRQKVMQITKAASLTEALGIVQANALAAERYAAAEKKLDQVEQDQAEKEFDLLAKAGDLAGKFTPAMQKGDWAKGLRAKGSAGVKELKAFLDHAPVLVSRKAVIEADDDLENVELTPTEIEVAKRMSTDPASLKARLDALRTQKLEDLRLKKANGR